MIDATIKMKEVKYPLLMSKSLCGEELVVLFSDKHYGTVIKSNSTCYPIGTFLNDWDMKYFKACDFDIVLSNRIYKGT